MKGRTIVKSFFFHLLCITFGLLAIYPMIWMISSSLKNSRQFYADSFNLFPMPFHFENYVKGWSGFGSITFLSFFRNTFIVVVLDTFGVLLSSSLIAYGFARMKFRSKRFWFAMVMISLMLPSQIIMVPQYIMFYNLGWVNTFLPLIVPAFFGHAFSIFLILQFMRGIPLDLDEAAKIDGCNTLQIYGRVILPLIKPALITAGIFQFYWRWDEFMNALIYLGKPQLYTVSVALKMFCDATSDSDWGSLFAMSTLSIIPPILIFFIFQKYIVEGISTSGMKT